MKISIVTNGYLYTEVIQRSQNSLTSETSPVDTDEFEKTLKEFQDKLAVRANEVSSKNVENTGTTPTVNTVASTDKVTVGATASDYQSIAPEGLQGIFKKASETYGIDQKLLELIGYHESRFKTDATSKSGAMGVMQLMPATAKSLGVSNAYEPEQNIMGATKLLKQLSDMYNGDLDLMLSAYSAGSNAVKKYGGVPPYKETTDYIAWIRERYP